MKSKSVVDSSSVRITNPLLALTALGPEFSGSPARVGKVTSESLSLDSELSFRQPGRIGLRSAL